MLIHFSHRLLGAGVHNGPETLAGEQHTYVCNTRREYRPLEGVVAAGCQSWLMRIRAEVHLIPSLYRRPSATPRSMMVAVPEPVFQHSPTLGHCASSHTVCSFSERREPLR